MFNYLSLGEWARGSRVFLGRSLIPIWLSKECSRLDGHHEIIKSGLCHHQEHQQRLFRNKQRPRRAMFSELWELFLWRSINGSFCAEGPSRNLNEAKTRKRRIRFLGVSGSSSQAKFLFSFFLVLVSGLFTLDIQVWPAAPPNFFRPCHSPNKSVWSWSDRCPLNLDLNLVEFCIPFTRTVI